MFFIDDILLSPAKGFMWIVRELHKAAQNEIEGEAERLTHRLSTLYMMLETEQITSEQFDEQEQEILQRLDEIQSARGGMDDDSLDDEGEDDDAQDEEEVIEDDGVDDEQDTTPAPTDDASPNDEQDDPDLLGTPRGSPR